MQVVPMTVHRRGSLLSTIFSVRSSGRRRDATHRSTPMALAISPAVSPGCSMTISKHLRSWFSAMPDRVMAIAAACEVAGSVSRALANRSCCIPYLSSNRKLRGRGPKVVVALPPPMFTVQTSTAFLVRFLAFMYLWADPLAFAISKAVSAASFHSALE